MPYQSIEDLNQNLSTNNPQWFMPQPKPLKQYSPMGDKAVSPDANVQKTPNVLPPGQSNTGIATPPKQPVNTTYPGLVGSLANMGANGSPELNQAINEKAEFERGYNRQKADRGLLSNPFGYVGSLDSLAANRHSQDKAVYEQRIANQLAAQGQRIGATGTAAGLAAPQQVSPGNFYVDPQTGMDVSGGSINPGTGGARIAGVELGKNGVLNQPKINSAAGYVNETNRILNTGNFNQSDLNVFNLLHNIANSNTSNPLYPQLQSNFNNAVNFYAQVMGQDPSQLISTLASTGKSGTVSGALSALDRMAREYNQNIINYSQNSNATPTNIQPIQPQAPVNQPTGSTYNGISLPN